MINGYKRVIQIGKYIRIQIEIVNTNFVYCWPNSSRGWTIFGGVLTQKVFDYIYCDSGEKVYNKHKEVLDLLHKYSTESDVNIGISETKLKSLIQLLDKYEDKKNKYFSENGN